MKVIKQEDIDINEIASELRNGAVIVYPTETCYGLGCDATNEVAVQKIFDIKKRQKDKPVLVVVPDIDMIMQHIEWSPTLETIANRYWPGALTAVVDLVPEHPFVSGVFGSDNTIAFRVTAHSLAAELSEQLGKPLVSTSANIAAQESAYDAESILNMFQDEENQPDIFIDAGTLPHQSPSTIIKIEHGEMIVLRQGEVIVNSTV